MDEPLSAAHRPGAGAGHRRDFRVRLVGLMFFSAALNVIVALSFSVVAWASFMSVYGIVSKLGLFLIQYATMRTIGIRRRRAMPIPDGDGLVVRF
jgi:hypothetical protein